MSSSLASHPPSDPADGATPALMRRLAANTSWTILGGVVARGSTFAAAFITARLLGKSIYGQLGAIESSLEAFAVVGSLGLSLTATKFIAKHRRDDPERAGRLLALCIAFSIVAATLLLAGLGFGAAAIASRALASDALIPPLRVAALALAMMVVNSTLSGAALGFQAYRSSAQATAAAAVAAIPLAVGLTAWFGLAGAVWGMVALQTANLLAYALVVRRCVIRERLTLPWRQCWREVAALRDVSLPALVNASLRTPVNWIMVSWLVSTPGGYDQMGLLQVANVWFMALLFLPAKLAQAYFPMCEDALARGDRREARELMLKSVRLNGLAAGAIALIVTLAAKPILQLYGNEYVAAWPALTLTVWTAALAAAQQPVGAWLVAQSRMWLVAGIAAVWAGVFLTVGHALLPQGALGFAAARGVAYASYSALIVAAAWSSMRPEPASTPQPMAPLQKAA